MSVAAFCRLVAQGTPVLLQSGLQRAAASALSRVAPISQQRQIDIWWPGSGFASAAGGDGSGGGSGSGASAGSTASGGQRLGEDEKGRQQPQPPQQQQQQGNQPQQQQQSSAQARLEEKGQSEASQPGPAQGEQAAAAAANSGGAGSTGGETQGLETGDIHPELKKYIDQLKQLKGSATVQRQEVGGPPTWWQQLIQVTLGSWLQHVIGELIRSKVEREFDVGEFLEGAKDAFHTVHELMAAEDWETLKPMMSAKLFDAFKGTADAYKADGLRWRTALGPEPWEAAVRGVGFMTRQEMQAYDPAIASLAPESVSMAAAPTGMFLVVTAQLRVEQNVTISRVEDGLVVAELRDMRPMRWKFATGPLPGDLPVDQLGSQWFLLSI